MSWPWEIAASGRTPTYALPTGWSVARVGDITSLENGQPYESKFFGEEGTPLIRIRDVLGGPIETRYSGPSPTSHRVRKGDLLVGMDGDFNVGQWGHDEPGLLNQRVLALEAPPEISAWVGYCLPEPLALINELTYSTTVKHLTSQAVSSIRIPLPDRTNLRRLVDYLDHETAEIDAFIAEFSELSRLNGERTATAIRETFRRVSRQYHDNRQKVSWNARVFSGRPVTGTLDERPNEVNSVPVYGGNGFVAYTSKPMRRDRTVVVGRVGAHCGNVHLSPAPIWVTDNALVVAPVSDAYLPSYLALSLENENLNERADRTAQPLITGGMVASLRLPVPPRSEQVAVVNRVNEYKDGYESLRREVSDATRLARERRAALISAAVTGQIDVTKRHKPVAEVLEDEVREMI